MILRESYGFTKIARVYKMGQRLVPFHLCCCSCWLLKPFSNQTLIKFIYDDNELIPKLDKRIRFLLTDLTVFNPPHFV